MAVNYMTRKVIPNYNNQRYEYDESLTYVSVELTSDWIILPGGISRLSCTLSITSGEGKIQTTNNKIDDVISGTGIIAVDWPKGSVITTIQDEVVGNATAIRFICTSGTVRLLLTAQ